MQTLRIINYIISIIFLICYSYQFIYIPIALIGKHRKKKRSPNNLIPQHSFAVLISARNEEKVIPDLLKSLHNQDYPQDKISIFVIADNCTDNTAFIAKTNGATVYIRRNLEKIGKGYAISELLRHIRNDYPKGFDGYLVFDADNILSPCFISEINKKMSDGYDIITSYRNSKNYSDNWISSGYAIWFLRESRFLNGARDIIGSSCHVSGTGFMFSRAVLESMQDWPYHLLTEDIEFSVDQVLKGRRIAFCEDAELYDEQPTDLITSLKQRARWTKGYVQVIRKYGVQLIISALHGNYSCFDLLMSIMPAFMLSLASLICNISIIAMSFFSGTGGSLVTTIELISNAYTTLFIIGALTTISEWKHIHGTIMQKFFYSLTFPLFMCTYIPVSIYAIFTKPEWKCIPHVVTFGNNPQMKEIYKKTINY